MATITFDKVKRLIQISIADAEVTIQEIINAVRDWEAMPNNMEIEQIINASGKQILGEELFVGITLELINNWRIEFAARPGPDYVRCMVSGGNLVAVNIYGNNPVKPSAFTQVIISQSTAASISAASVPSAQENATVLMQQMVDDTIDVNVLFKLLSAKFIGEMALSGNGVTVIYKNQLGETILAETYAADRVERAII